MKDLEINIKPKQAILLLKLLVIGGIMAALAYSGLFLYENFYQVMTKTDEIAELKKNMARETINMKKFHQITKALEKKKNITSVKNINNPFD